MRSIRYGVALALVGGLTWPPPAPAQQVICCAAIINVDGNWVGAGRVERCQDFLDQAPPATLRRMCEQRGWLSCLDTSRCDTLPPPEKSPEPSSSAGAAPLPPDPDRDGVADGFRAPPPRATTSPPPAAGLSTPRLVYLVRARSSDGGAPLTAFTVHLDRNACAVPLAVNGRPVNPSAAERVVRGRVTRAEGRVRVDAEAASKDGAVLATATGEATGGDRAAVAAATRAAATGLKLVCAR